MPVDADSAAEVTAEDSEAKSDSPWDSDCTRKLGVTSVMIILLSFAAETVVAILWF